MKVKFMPQNVELEIKPGQSVMGLAHENNIVIRSTCNGMPSCAECRVKVTDGDWNVNPPSRKELNLIGTGYYIDQRRLSCQMQCFGDITVDTTEQIEKSAEGPVTKKFLTKVHKSSAQESHSLGGVLIEQDGKLLHELKKDVSENVGPSAGSAGLQMRDDRPNRGGGGRDGGGGNRDRGGRGGNRNAQARHAGSGGNANRDGQSADGQGGGNREGGGGGQRRGRRRRGGKRN